MKMVRLPQGKPDEMLKIGAAIFFCFLLIYIYIINFEIDNLIHPGSKIQAYHRGRAI